MLCDGLVEGKEPDGGFALLAVLSIECVEDFLRRFGRAEDLVQQRGGLLLESELR